MEKGLKNSRTWIYTILSAMISFVALYMVIMILAPKVVKKVLVDTPNQSIVVPLASAKDSELLMQYSNETICLKDVTITDKSKCFEQHNKPALKKREINIHRETPKRTTPFEWALNQIVNASLFIQLMYFLSFVALTRQIKLYLILKYYPYNDATFKYYLDNRDTISDFTTNIPVMGGVLATMFAFSEYAGSADSSMALMEAFKVSVYDGVSTTLVGGMVYMFNMYLNISIQKEVCYENKT